LVGYDGMPFWKNDGMFGIVFPMADGLYAIFICSVSLFLYISSEFSGDGSIPFWMDV